MRAAVSLLATAVLLAGCGLDADEPSLSDAAASRLHKHLADARAAAADGSADRATAALRRFKSAVARLSSEGALASPEAGALIAQAQRAEARIPLDVGSPPEDRAPAVGGFEEGGDHEEDEKGDDEGEKHEDDGEKHGDKDKKHDREGEDDD